jgi:hypothetical protein
LAERKASVAQGRRGGRSGEWDPADAQLENVSRPRSAPPRDQSQASDSTAKSIAGHVSQKMLGHYNHVRIEAKRRAVDALSSRAPVGCGTNHGTKLELEGLPNLQLVEKAGGDDGARTRDLMRDRHAF